MVGYLVKHVRTIVSWQGTYGCLYILEIEPVEENRGKGREKEKKKKRLIFLPLNSKKRRDLGGKVKEK